MGPRPIRTGTRINPRGSHIVAAALSVITVTSLVFVGRAPGPTPSTSRSPTPSPTPTSSPGAQNGDGGPRARLITLGFQPADSLGALPKGSVFAYVRDTPDGRERVIAELRRDGRTRACVVDARLYGVLDDRILYRQRGALWEIDRPCAEGSRRIVGIRDILGHDRDREAFLDCARYSPNGRWIALTVHSYRSGGDPCGAGGSAWVVRSDGTRLHRVADRATAAGWAGRRHVIVHQSDPRADPYAVDALTGATRLLTMPRAAIGALSPDGARSLFERRVFVRSKDRQIITERSLAIANLRSGAVIPLDPIETVHPKRNLMSWWNREGSHVLFGGSIYRRDGANVFDALPEGRLRWLDDERLWKPSRRGFFVLRIRLREPIGAVAFSEIEVPGARGVRAILAPRTDPGYASEAVLVEPENVRRTSLGYVSFTMPPSWTLHRCRCAPIPYTPATILLDTVGIRYNLDHPLSFTTTEASVERTAQRIIDANLALFSTRIVDDATIRLAGYAFRRLLFQHYEGSTLVYVGRPADRTIIIGVDPEVEDGEPSTRFVLDSLRF